MLRFLLIIVLTSLSNLSLACDRSAASTVQDGMRSLARISERGGVVIYDWGPYWDNQGEDRRLRLVRGAADADSCLSGRAREMKFYANGRLVGIASPNSGIRLVK